MFQTLGQSPTKEGLCVEETLDLKELVHLINGKESATILSKEVDVEAVELVLGSVADTLLNQRNIVSNLHAIVRIQATEHLAKHRDVGHLRRLRLDVCEELQHPVPVSFEQLRVVIELLTIGQHRSSLGKPNILTIAEKAGVGTMHLLLHYIFQILWHFSHHALHELTTEGVFDRAVLLEFNHYSFHFVRITARLILMLISCALGQADEEKSCRW